MKTLVMAGMIFGSYTGNYLPTIWGDGMFSVTSILFGAAGGFLGIWAGYRLASRLGLG